MFNENKPINQNLRDRIQSHFTHRWQNDKNIVVNQNKEIFDQLPEEVQSSLYTNFLFKDFMMKFSGFFRLSPHHSFYGVGRGYYTWTYQPYRYFMMELVNLLEPRQEKKYVSMVEELDEINEIIFVMKGTVVVGYEINKQKRYCIKYENKCEVGAFGLTFN